MPHCIYTGQALAVPQITTITIGGTVASGNTVWLEINRKRATATAQAGDTAAILAGRLYDAINALSTGGNAPEFTEVVFVDPRIAVAASFTATSNTAGQPFTVTTGATGGGATISTTATQAATGPNHLNNAANWSTNTLPATGDDITFPAGCPDYLYGLTALTAVDAVTVRFLGGNGGLAERTGTTPNDPNNYIQYRDKFVELKSATSIAIGNGTDAPESLRLRITGATTTTIRVMAGEGTATGQSIQLSAAAGTAHTVTILGNSVAIAPNVGEVLEIGTLRIGTDGPEASFGATDTDPTVVIGTGATITSARLYGGTVTSDGTFTSLAIIDGTWSQDRGTPGTVSATDSAGTYRYAGNASHGAITARGPGVTIDLTPDSRGFTLANSSVTEGAAIYNPQRANCTSLTIDKESIAVSELGNSITVTLTAA